MPLIPEEPQIHESAQGPRATSATGRNAPTPRPVPGPRPAAPPRPGRPGPARTPAQRTPRESAVPSPATQAATPQKAGTGAAVGAQPTSGTAAATPQIQLIPASVEGALDAAEEAVDLLLDSGRAPGDVLVITTGERHPWATHELSFGEAAYWAQHDAGDDIFYTDGAGAGRAAVRPVVVVALNGGDDTAVRTLPVALGRAGVLLIVCGDPERINSLLGVAA
ncbi:hypothetical protein [Streptomyces tsukubensis]|uniref:Uncharacterized protein n=1 Tax=Streptomyces tsukubensis TaxID=83656 RepID=A0A1V4A513_9ACTN|nr:hypothetical protein [Streptomyces tsukubensis]OON75145.1 hypothetical protein B1H18_23610 [Streptomyces tsukubensis]QFR96108.1 hypothetical protein GBW32_27515 [Streptomyces tsukubensis]